MRRKIFITATDTGAGKTFITCKLISALLQQGIQALAIKPVACGTSPRNINEDVSALMHAQNKSNPDQVNLYSFLLPASPNIAAQDEGKSINPSRLVAWCNQQAEQTELCLIEGVGGLMVPLNDRYCVSDWIADLKDCQTMLVVGARLGCINHALLTIEQLDRLNMPPKHVLINALDESNMAEQVRVSLQPFVSSDTLLTTIPYQASQESFQPLIRNLLTSSD